MKGLADPATRGDGPLSRRAFFTRLAQRALTQPGKSSRLEADGAEPDAPPASGGVELSRHREQDCTRCGSPFPVAAGETECPACRKSLALTRDVFEQLFGARG